MCIHHIWIHTLFDPTVGAAECISPLPFSVSSQASPCSDLFQCVVASRVCVRLQPCPVKYRLFKEVSSIIWPLYCNYKLLLLEIAQRERERAAHRHLLSSSPGAAAIAGSAPADALVSVQLLLLLLLALTQMFPLQTTVSAGDRSLLDITAS